MNISVYFEPFELPDFTDKNNGDSYILGNLIKAYSGENKFPETGNADIAIIGVKEDRNCVDNQGCKHAPDYVRNQLYVLKRGNYEARIVDLGNLKNGHTTQDTYFALSTVITELLNNKILPVIIGGSQDLTFANYKAYEALGQVVNIVSVDPVFDLGKSDDSINSKNYLNKIILHQPNFLFNFTNIGYQSYFVDPESIKLMNNLYFDVYRLGKIRDNIEFTEPLVRNADILSVDISSIRQSDAPANNNTSPNGFHGEEACQIMWYAGLSDKLSSIGFYELNPQFDRNGQTSKLVAQMIWYFIEGFYNRKHDHPYKDSKDYLKYVVSIKDHKDQLIFYKSKKSDRWWMDVPVKKNLKSIYERHHLIPCSYYDYEIACKDDIPDRWWQAYQKLM
ncbi:MAG: formimidoylglutamase [Bacteroidales bacterium]|nr:formimidoylglutamase [Bacteroidales bacterium]